MEKELFLRRSFESLFSGDVAARRRPSRAHPAAHGGALPRSAVAEKREQLKTYKSL